MFLCYKLRIYAENMNMTFQNRVKNEMKLKNWIVKELSAVTGISKRTLDQYLGVRESLPSADNAVKIAKALGVTVEYLVTGETAGTGTLAPDVRSIVEKLEVLDAADRAAVDGLIDSLALRYMKNSTEKAGSA